MRNLVLFICVLSFYCSSVIAQVENVKKKNDVQCVGDSLCYINGSLYTGEVIDYIGLKFDKTKILYDGHFVNGQRNGTFKQWYSNFKIEFIENYKMGKKEGMQTCFYKSGNKKSECKYLNGLRDGICNEWYDNKQQKSSYAFIYGNLADGHYFTYLENGQKEKEELYSGGLKISEKVYKNDTLYESLELKAEYDPVKKENSKGFLKNNKKDGLWTYWYDGAKKKKEGYYKNGIETGKWTFWYEDGRIEYEGTCLNGMKDGLGTITLKDGSVNYQGEFKSGKPDGKGTMFEKGKIVYDGEWKNGKMQGKGTYSYETGMTAKGDWFESTLTQGIITSTDNEGYSFINSGEFKDFQLFNGTLSMTKPDGSKYVTEFKEGKRGRLKKIE